MASLQVCGCHACTDNVISLQLTTTITDGQVESVQTPFFEHSTCSLRTRLPPLLSTYLFFPIPQLACHCWVRGKQSRPSHRWHLAQQERQTAHWNSLWSWRRRRGWRKRRRGHRRACWKDLLHEKVSRKFAVRQLTHTSLVPSQSCPQLPSLQYTAS